MKQGKFIIAAASALALAGASTAGFAQRSPEYEAARQSGAIGEQTDGYLGIVGAATPQLRALVNDLNIQRKAKYTSGVTAGSTIEQLAFTSGCNLITKTVPGEKYQKPDGSWATRTSAPPVRDGRCV